MTEWLSAVAAAVVADFIFRMLTVRDGWPAESRATLSSILRHEPWFFIIAIFGISFGVVLMAAIAAVGIWKALGNLSAPVTYFHIAFYLSISAFMLFWCGGLLADIISNAQERRRLAKGQSAKVLKNSSALLPSAK